MRRGASWMGTPSIKGRTESTRMALLTFSLTGLSITWGIEMTYCTPYLLQLGLTKSRTSLVWIAGPLSGLIMQPIVGIITDRSRSRWGRRRPFMIGGSIIVAFCLLILGWTSEVVGMFVQDVEKRKTVTIAVAVLSIYAVDFAINAVQACSRSLIVDTLPIPQQQTGSAWATRMSAIGNLIGYGIGTIDMVNLFGTRFGDTQFKQMTVVAALSLITAVSITSYAVQERVLISRRDEKAGLTQVLSQLIRTNINLPPRIQAICWVQFWSWIGWFPFLFYSTTWVGETYFRYQNPDSVRQSTDTLGDVGRLGSLSLVIFSFITLLSSVFLPFGIRSPENREPRFTPRPPPGVAAFLKKMRAIRPDLQAAWFISHLMFAATMIFAPLAKSVAMATFLVAICGIPWAISGWAPFTFMGIEINRLEMEKPSNPTPTASMITSTSFRTHGYRPIGSVDADAELDVLRLNHRNGDDSDDDSETEASSTGELAGIYLGVLNVYTTLPQFVGTFISWLVFSILEPGVNPAEPMESETTTAAALAAAGGGITTDGTRGDGEWMRTNADGPNAIAVCLFIGALSAVVAAESTRRFRTLHSYT